VHVSAGLGGGRRKGSDVIGTWSGEGRTESAFKFAEMIRLDVELPVQVGAHLAFHLVDLTESEHALADDAPRLVAVSVVTDHLAGDHERRQEQTMTGRSAGGREALFEALKEVEGGEGNRLWQTGAVEGVSDENCEIR
jgi:hypothetical protein